MSTRWVAGVVALCVGLGLAREAGAQGWCDDVFGPDPDRDGEPECYTGPGYGATSAVLIHKRIDNICPEDSGVNRIAVEVVYPPPAIIPAGVHLTPIIFQHGGGAADSFCDEHTTSTAFPFTCVAPGPSPGHYANPYYHIVSQLVHKGAVVMLPVLDIGPKSKPHVDSLNMVRAVECLGRRTSTDTCAAGNIDCLTDLVGRVAWSTSDRSNIVAVGHSAGAVAALYLPRRLGGSLRALILIDPAKAEYTFDPPTGMSTPIRAPLFHIYSDWYGPFKHGENQLFRLGAPNSCAPGLCVGGSSPGSACVDPCPGGGSCASYVGTPGLGGYHSCVGGDLDGDACRARCPGAGGFCTDGLGCSSSADCGGGSCTGPAPVTGAWVPMAIRDDAGCDPDTGCHKAHHCNAFDDSEAWQYTGVTPPHFNYCNPDTTGACTGITGHKQAPSGACSPGSTGCGRASVCRRNIGNATGTTLSGGGFTAGTYMTYRYAVAFAACFGGRFGSRYQSWVNGMDRAYDDNGIIGGTCTTNGQSIGGACAGFGDKDTCNAQWSTQNCHWADGNDGSRIRINNGGSVTEYNPHTSRWYTAAEGYSATGTCVGGSSNGSPCTTDAGCPGGNCTAGDFTERMERISTAMGDPSNIVCSSAHPGF